MFTHRLLQPTMIYLDDHLLSAFIADVEAQSDTKEATGAVVQQGCEKGVSGRRAFPVYSRVSTRT